MDKLVSLKFDEWSRPVIKAQFLEGKKMLRHEATMLVDMGATFSLVLAEFFPFHDWEVRTWKAIEGFNGENMRIGFTKPVQF